MNKKSLIMPETIEEIDAMNTFLLKMREEKKRQAYQKQVQSLRDAIAVKIAESVWEIGFNETKDLVKTLVEEMGMSK